MNQSNLGIKGAIVLIVTTICLFGLSCLFSDQTTILSRLSFQNMLQRFSFSDLGYHEKSLNSSPFRKNLLVADSILPKPFTVPTRTPYVVSGSEHRVQIEEQVMRSEMERERSKTIEMPAEAESPSSRLRHLESSNSNMANITLLEPSSTTLKHNDSTMVIKF